MNMQMLDQNNNRSVDRIKRHPFPQSQTHNGREKKREITSLLNPISRKMMQIEGTNPATQTDNASHDTQHKQT